MPKVTITRLIGLKRIFSDIEADNEPLSHDASKEGMKFITFFRHYSCFWNIVWSAACLQQLKAFIRRAQLYVSSYFVKRDTVLRGSHNQKWMGFILVTFLLLRPLSLVVVNFSQFQSFANVMKLQKHVWAVVFCITEKIRLSDNQLYLQKLSKMFHWWEQ